MKRMTVPAMLAAGVLAFTLAGCSSNQPMSEDLLKGVWSLDSQTEMGFDAYMRFEDQSAFEMILADSYLDGTWSVSGADGSIVIDNGETNGATVKLSYSNNKLTMGKADGSKLVFVKDDSKEAKELFEYDGEEVGSEGSDASVEELEVVDEVINPIDPPVVIADDDKATITVTGKGTDFTGDPCYRLNITNKTSQNVYFVGDDVFKVGDKQIEAGLGDELEAGETLEVDMYFPTDELGGGLEKLTTTDGVIVMYDDKTDAELARYTFHMD